MSHDPESSSPISQRLVKLLATAIIAVAFIGYFVGIDHGVPRRDPGAGATQASHGLGDIAPRAQHLSQSRPEDEAIDARSYASIREQPLGPTRAHATSLEPWIPKLPDPSVVIDVDPEEKHASLAMRSSRRAYNGAPPVIPHAVDAIDGKSCIACHRDGFRTEGLTARAMSHPYYENCTQCHAPPPPEALRGPDSAPAANTFVGVAAPFEGERAWPGAPPTIPHSTWMRDNCLACHGPAGWPGMETSHPWRAACLQCHAPSAVLDQRPGSRDAEFLPTLKVSSP